MSAVLPILCSGAPDTLLELSAVVAGPLGFLSCSRALVGSVLVFVGQSLQPNFGPEEVQAVLEALWVPQAEVTPEKFTEAVGQARGPPTLEWCQAEALCALYACCGDHCNFKEPVLGSQQDMSAAYISEEQGWDMEWVAVQLLKGHKGKVLGQGSRVECGGSMGQLMKVGLLQGRQREGAPTTHDKGKQRASPSLEAGPSKWLQEEGTMAVHVQIEWYKGEGGF
ncbi:hypothetical protein E4T56_gene11676 [Termitomyces sp. T112]|nr:hypothetical protein E4T56_gene11676 [Termitomyces sp. T112]